MQQEPSLTCFPGEMDIAEAFFDTSSASQTDRSGLRGEVAAENNWGNLYLCATDIILIRKLYVEIDG